AHKKLRLSRCKSFFIVIAARIVASSGQLFGSPLDGFADSYVRRTAAEIAAHRLFNVCFGWFAGLFKQRHRAHDLTTLAITALDHVFFDPGIWHRASDWIRSDALDRGYLPVLE